MLRSRAFEPAESDPLLSIGAVAERTGLAVSAVRFYADQGLVEVERSEAGHRRFRRSAIRRISFIVACQRLGYSLGEIGDRLAALPEGRTPTDDDWEQLATGFRADLDERIAGLISLRDQLSSCIGCGCLSLERCALYNPDDAATEFGAGPRYLLGDSFSDLSRGGSRPRPTA